MSTIRLSGFTNNEGVSLLVTYVDVQGRTQSEIVPPGRSCLVMHKPDTLKVTLVETTN